MFDVQEKSCEQQGKIKRFDFFQNATFCEILSISSKFLKNLRMGDHLMFKETDLNSPKERLYKLIKMNGDSIIWWQWHVSDFMMASVLRCCQYHISDEIIMSHLKLVTKHFVYNTPHQHRRTGLTWVDDKI